MLKPLSSYFSTASTVSLIPKIPHARPAFFVKGAAATALLALTGCAGAAGGIATGCAAIGVGIWGIARHVRHQRRLLHDTIASYIANEDWGAINDMLHTARTKRKLGAIQRALMHEDHRDHLPLDILASIIEAEGNSLKPCLAAYLMIFQDCADKWAKGIPTFADSLCEFTDQSTNKFKWIELEKLRWSFCEKYNIAYNLPLTGHLFYLGIFLPEVEGLRAAARIEVPPRLCADEAELPG